MDVQPDSNDAGTSGDEFFSDDRTSGHSGTIELPDEGYEHFLFDPQDPTITRYRGQRYDDYARDRVEPSFVQDLLAYWDGLYREPFRGVTTDGAVLPALYALGDIEPSSSSLRSAALRVLELLTDAERARYRYPIDAREWRAWSNPEFVIYPVGLRLEDLAEPAALAVLDLLRASLSPEGYELVTKLMDLNGFLGRLVDLPTVMNPRSYCVALFGDPTGDEPWGWQLFGHHVALNFLAVGGRHVVAPVFLGAEPALTSDGEPSAFESREAVAIELASSLSVEQRAAAVVYDSVLDPAMPEGRLHPADERHVAGAFRDNRVIPYEGVSAATFSAEQRALLLALVADYLVLLVEPQRTVTLHDVEAHLDETSFCWYGATDGSQPFYFRIQGPTILAELDHHAGVWLTNRLPARFHVHTTLRLPNGNDYGRAYIDQWRARRGETSTDGGWGA
jgi:Protein of unknown function (DUF3500)